MTGTLRRWWRRLFPAPQAAAPAEPPAGSRSGGGTVADAHDTPAARAPSRRRYTRLPESDPRLEAHLGAVLQAVASGPLRRDDLGRRVDAGEWGVGRLDAVVDHGLAAHVLVESDDGAVRARYAD